MAGLTDSRAGWTCRWALARTGQIRSGAICGLLSGSGDITLNQADQATVDVDARRAWPGVDPEWRGEGSGAMVILLGDTPILLGVIAAPPDEPTPGVVGYNLAGVWSVLDDRLITARHFAADEIEAMKTSVWQRSGMSWGSICQEIVRTAMDKPGGDLPIVFGQPVEPVPGGPSLTLAGWDLASLSAGEQLRRIAELGRGPDIAFRPRVEDGRAVAVMVHGTHNQPSIWQARTVTWDETAESSPLVDLQVMTPPVDHPGRAYASGVGDGQEIALAIADDTSQYTQLKVYRERAYTGAAGLDDPNLLAAAARSHVRSSPLVQAKATVRLTDRRAAYGATGWQVGDLIRVITSPRASLAGGLHWMRAMAMRFTIGRDLAEVTLEEELL